ncbi:sugar phosphate isomerase/epimerase [Puniceicoccaceae bacterium K14]|nr:sugar phosphate isomerase/epimerase [Puniceicoccaceae bacterium K14]
MIKAGICTITLARYSPESIIAFASETGLQGMEWWGGEHVPPGDISTAQKVGNLTRSTGLEVASYGAYYRAGISESEGLSFNDILASASALGAPAIRVWAGDKDTSQADSSYIQKVVDDTHRIADMAAAQDISITFEFHGGSLTDNSANAVAFSKRVPHPNVFFSWQPPHGYDLLHKLHGLIGLIDRLSTLHTYHWTIGSYEANTLNETIRPLVYPDDFHRHPLSDGENHWKKYFKIASQTRRDHFALLEFVKNDTLAQAREDAATLIRLTNGF